MRRLTHKESPNQPYIDSGRWRPANWIGPRGAIWAVISAGELAVGSARWRGGAGVAHRKRAGRASVLLVSNAAAATDQIQTLHYLEHELANERRRRRRAVIS